VKFDSENRGVHCTFMALDVHENGNGREWSFHPSLMYFRMYITALAQGIKYYAVIHKMCSDNVRLCSDKELFVQ